MAQNTLPSFYDALTEFLALSKQQMFRIAAEYDLTSTQTFLLMLTPQDELRTMQSYCGLLGCDASNVTGLVDGLERKGLMKRTEHPTDRRIKVVQLSEKGIALRDAITGKMCDRNSNYILSKLTPEEVQQFTRLIQKITAGACPVAPKPQAKMAHTK